MHTYSGDELGARSTNTRFACAWPAATLTVEKLGAPLFPPNRHPLLTVYGTTVRNVLTVPAIPVRLMIAISSVPSVGIDGQLAGTVHHSGIPATFTLTA